MARLHPGISRRKYRELGVPGPRRTRAHAGWLPYAAVLVAVTVAAGVYFASSPSGGAPRFTTDHTYYDFGFVPQSVVEHSFRFTNMGEDDLALLGVWTSCGCTSAHLIVGGVQSPHFGMHDNPPWSDTLAPGAEATLVVRYDATEHPDLYVGERSVFVKTNDPSNPEVEFRIRVSEA